MDSPLPFVLLTVSVPPTFRLLPPPPLLNGESTHTSPLPVMLSPPLVLADAPPDSRKSPATAALPVADRVAPDARFRAAGASTWKSAIAAAAARFAVPVWISASSVEMGGLLSLQAASSIDQLP